MKTRRFATVVAAFAVGALTLTACATDSSGTDGTGTTADGPSAGIVTANGSEPENPLIPANTNEVGGGRILDLLFAGLVSYDVAGTPQNEVAASIETDDSQHYTITLQDGWEFSNGEAVTAQSFVDAWQHGALLSNANLSRYFFEPIEGYSDDADQPLTGLAVVDDRTFTVTLSQPEADFPLRLGYSAFFPLPSVAFDDLDAYGEAPIGNGPYQLASEDAWEHNVQISVVPSATYAGERVAQNGGVTIRFYENQDAAYADLLSDQLDVLDAIPDSAFATFEDELGDRAVNQPAAVFQSFTLGEWLPHLSGEEGRLRRAALSMAIDREQVTEVIFDGTRTPARDFTSPVIDGWSDRIPGSEVLDHDPEQAKELWAQADAISPWTGTLTIAYNTDGGHQAWVDAVTNGIRNVLGIDAEGQPYAVFADLRADVNAARHGEASGLTGGNRSGWQADYPGLFNFLGPLYGTGAGSNDGEYSNPEVDRLLAEGSAAPSVAAANVLFQEAQEVLFEDLPAIPLWYANATGGYSTLVEDVEFGWNQVPLYEQITKD